MGVYKDKDRWMVRLWYKDYTGRNRNTTKRGFATKREAKEWEREFLMKKGSGLDMTFSSFVEKYNRDREGVIRHSTYESKQYIINSKILPFFGNKKIRDITPNDITEWHNELLEMRDKNGKLYSDGYLRTIHAVMSAIFNHAVKVCNLPHNPARQAGGIGGSTKQEMKYWEVDEYQKFRDVVAENENSMCFYAFETLFWTGIRKGELLALTPADFDFETQVLHISRQHKHTAIRPHDTRPKTESGDRYIKMPKKLSDELEYYISTLYGLGENDRLFTLSKSALHRVMERCTKKAGVKKIRVHDLRHSHVAMLINCGHFTPFEIAKRMGHETEHITLLYAHLYPSSQDNMANKLDSMMEEDFDVKKE